jgi:hypothetical protein
MELLYLSVAYTDNKRFGGPSVSGDRNHTPEAHMALRPRTPVLLATVVGLIVGGSAVVATAGTDDPCNALTSERAYNECRFDRIEKKIDALGTTAPGPTVTPTITPTAPPTTATPTITPTAPAVTLTVTGITSSTATLNWTAVPGATGYLVGRDGTAADGGAWSTTDPATARSRTFDKLRADSQYILFVEPKPGTNRRSVTFRTAAGATPTVGPTTTSPPPTTPTSTPPVVPGDSSPGWLSGAASTFAAQGSFGAWRGSPVEIGGTWLNSAELYTLRPASACAGCTGEWSSFTGAMDVGIVPPSWTSWAAEAGGQHDEYFRSVFRAIKVARAGKGPVYLRFWYEYNGNWMTYSVRNASDAANFKVAYNRVARIARAEYPEAKIMLGTSAGGPTSVASTYPDDSLVDLLSIDRYNNYPHCLTQACFDNAQENAGGANSLNDLQRLAKEHGDPIMISEWSNQGARRDASQGGGGESPQFMRSWNAWLRANAGTGPGQVVGEVHFNLWADQFEFFDGTTTRLQPETAAEYRRLW